MKRDYKIGIFDSGYGGLTILKAIKDRLPQYDYIYLGDNARTPYGTRSFEVVYEYTLASVKQLFNLGCNLVILACNTASAKALRTIQQNDLPKIAPDKRVLGVIRPSIEAVVELTKTNNVGVLGTTGTVASESYVIELDKISNGKVNTYQEACPMWVPIVENNEIDTPGADYFIEKNIQNLLQQHPKIDTVILGCTHYPLLRNSIQKFIPSSVNVVSQGEIVAAKLENYLERHPELEEQIGCNGFIEFYTTERSEYFNAKASLFYGNEVEAKSIHY